MCYGKDGDKIFGKNDRQFNKRGKDNDYYEFIYAFFACLIIMYILY